MDKSTRLPLIHLPAISLDVMREPRWLIRISLLQQRTGLLLAAGTIYLIHHVFLATLSSSPHIVGLADYGAHILVYGISRNLLIWYSLCLTCQA